MHRNSRGRLRLRWKPARRPRRVWRSCPADTDGDGVCDDAEVDGCTNPFACNYNAAATDDDGSCLTADVLALAAEAALPMRMVTVSATTWTTAWAPSTPVASAMDPARSMTAGATGIPAGDCDCDGNQLDALGECGGSCPADTDGDGVCDDAEVDGCTNPLPATTALRPPTMTDRV